MPSTRACSSRTASQPHSRGGFTALRSAPATDVPAQPGAEHEDMSSYAVLWSEPPCDVEAGKLELEPRSIRFEGSHAPRGACVHRVYYDNIHGVHIGHKERDRLRGRPAIVVDLVDGSPLLIGSVDGVGTVSELADELTRLSGH